MTFDFHQEAETEFLEAIDCCESCSPGLGEDFSLEVNSTVQNILSYTYAWPILEDDVRRCRINRLPYGVLYSLEPDRIYILAGHASSSAFGLLEVQTIDGKNSKRSQGDESTPRFHIKIDAQIYEFII
jgi:hypothetical protein